MSTATPHTGPETVADGLCFPEGARWHDGALWFSDVHAGEVLRLDPDTGDRDVVAALGTAPSGLGFLPDGRLLIASGTDLTVRRREHDGTLVCHADLSGSALWQLNDMYVDGAGRAYVGDYGDDSAPPSPPRPAPLLRVDPDGTVTAAADGLQFANGIGATAGGRTLLVAETRSEPGRLSAFSVGAGGELGARRTFCVFGPGVMPDGIAVDPDDNVWVASPFSGEVLRVAADGAVDRRIAAPDPYAVAFRPTASGAGELFVCSSPDWRPEEARARRGGRILRVRID